MAQAFAPWGCVAKQEGLASNHVGSDSILCQYIADMQLPVLAVNDRFGPLAERVANGLAGQGFSGQLRDIVLQPLVQGFQLWHGIPLSKGSALLVAELLLVHLALKSVQRIDHVERFGALGHLANFFRFVAKRLLCLLEITARMIITKDGYQFILADNGIEARGRIDNQIAFEFFK